MPAMTQLGSVTAKFDIKNDITQFHHLPYPLLIQITLSCLTNSDVPVRIGMVLP